MNALEALWLAYLSQPASDRCLYRTVRKLKPRRICEIGLGDGRRALRLVRFAKRYLPEGRVRYVGVDMFEDRGSTAEPALPLKSVYRQLRRAGAQVHLLPGDPGEALARSANSLPGNEMVLIAADQTPEMLARAWFYLPRMLALTALVLQAEIVGEKQQWRTVPHAEIERLAARGARRRAA